MRFHSLFTLLMKLAIASVTYSFMCRCFLPPGHPSGLGGACSPLAPWLFGARQLTAALGLMWPFTTEAEIYSSLPFASSASSCTFGKAKPPTSVPQVLAEIPDIVLAAGDLFVLVEGSDLKSRAAIVEELRLVAGAGTNSSHLIEAYAIHMASVGTSAIVASEEYLSGLSTEDAITGLGFSALGNWDNPPRETFLHALNDIKAEIHTLGEDNSAIISSLVLLEGHLDRIILLVDEETKEEVDNTRELPERWGWLGGGGSWPGCSERRLEGLAQVGSQTRLMKSRAFAAQEELRRLQVATNALRVSITGFDFM